MTSKEIAERIVFLADNGEGLHPIAEGEKLIKQHTIEFALRVTEQFQDLISHNKEAMEQEYTEWITPK